MEIKRHAATASAVTIDLWQAMSEAMSPNKVKAVRRLPHSFVRGGFLSDMGRKVTVPFLG